MKACFGKVPDEIISQIILQLPMIDILHCRMVSAHLNFIIQNSTTIQYKIELAAHGFVACPDSTLTAATSIRMLKEQQDAWRRGEWREDQVAHIPPGCCTYEFRSGIWAFGCRSDTVAGNPTGLPTDLPTAITCLQLVTSATRPMNSGAEKSQWCLDDLGISIRDFTMDPLIDLLVLVEQTTERSTGPFVVHIRKLSDGQPHEMAPLQVIPFDLMPFDIVSEDPRSCLVEVQLHDPYIGVLVHKYDDSDGSDYFIVWNWRKGKAEMMMENPENGLFDFAFIDTRSLILAVNGSHAVLQVWCFENCASFPMGRFALPRITQGHEYLDMHFDGGPPPSLADAKTLDGTPFALAPVSKVLAFSFLATQEVIDQIEANYTMVMLTSLMFDALGMRPCDGVKVLRRHAGGRVPHEYLTSRPPLEWEAWGPQCTRWFPTYNQLLRQPCMIGGRFALIDFETSSETVEPANLLSSPQVIRLYDFRPEIVSRYKQDFPQDICTDSTVISRGTMFEKDVVSKLPFHAVTLKELPDQVSAVMIDEGRLICTKAEPDDEWRTLFVLAF
ncbi:hypothetical protein JB92DRAFT_3047361 [Gautieria morchelliformis]|nr:hypothetical protein JB92DRAFT_3047361 [Gautieria morchelliformis]